MPLRTLATLAVIAVNVTPAIAAAADERWEITTRMEMTGLPMRMPATTVIVCVPPGGMNEERIVEQDGCTLGKVTKSGNTTRFSVQCTQPEPMSGEGEITQNGKDAYNGQFKASGKISGRAVELSASFNGKRSGDCEKSPAGTAAESDAGGMPPGVVMPDGFPTEGFDMGDPAVLEALRRLQQGAPGSAP